MPKRRKSKTWRFSTGQRGQSVTVEERMPGGALQGRVWSPDAGKYVRVSLGHRDRDRARRWAIEQAAKLQDDEDTFTSERVTWARVFAEYEAKKTPTKTRRERREDGRRFEMWSRRIGSQSPYEFDVTDWDSFMHERKTGAIDPRGNPVPEGERADVRSRSIHGDLAWLRSVAYWATGVKVGARSRLLSSNPLVGDCFRLPKLHPRRPLANGERFERTLAVADRVQMRVDWFGKRYRVTSYLSEWLPVLRGHGRRIGAVMALRERDLRLNEGGYGAIIWPDDFDKTDTESPLPVPMTADMRRAIDSALASLAIGERPTSHEGWLWPSPGNPEARCGDAFAGRQLLKAEALADLPKLNGSLWHAYRRWFGTRNKHQPSADVEAVGGWTRNSAALRTCYQLPDPEGMANVVLGTDGGSH
jgi:hypothetical protein